MLQTPLHLGGLPLDLLQFVNVFFVLGNPNAGGITENVVSQVLNTGEQTLLLTC